MYITSKKACKVLGVHANTLRKMADTNKIKYYKTESGQRRYDVDNYLGSKNEIKTICYCRVSSYKQKDDLQRQIEFMSERFPGAEIVKDIGSGLNYKRKGLNTILRRAMSGESIKFVSAHKDRITRFGFELIALVIEENGGELVVLNQNTLSPEQELTADLLNILHVFSYRMHGLRNYKKQVREALSNKRSNKDL